LLAYHQQGRKLPNTLSVSTGRGTHIYFHWPEGLNIRNSAGRLAESLDIRGEGGYVVIPPSIHPSGQHYVYDDPNEPIADAPEWLLEMIQQSAHPVPVTSQSVSSIGPGQRTPLLFKLAGKLRAEGVPPEGILAALQGLNATFNPPHGDKKLRQIAQGVERYPAGHIPGRLAPDLVCLADVEALPVPWLWEGYLAFGMLAMLSGDPDAGKTFIALAIAADLSNCRVPLSGDPCAPVTTLYLSRENAAEYVIRPRFDALGGNAKRFHLLKGGVQGAGDAAIRSGITLKDIALLGDALEQTRAKLIVIDPIQSYLGAEVDAHRSNETRPVMDGLIGLAEKHNACVLVVRHLSKASGGRAIHRGLGSIDLTGAVRMEMIAGNAAGDPNSRALVQIKNNVAPRADSLGYQILGEGMEAKLQWQGKSQLTADDLLAPDAEAEGRSDIAEAVDVLRERLSLGQTNPKEFAKETGIPLRTLQRAAKRLRVKRSRDGESGPWFWSLD
jgi:DNA repair protein RadA/Sms